MKYLSKQYTIFIILCTRYIGKFFSLKITELFNKKPEYTKFINEVQNI